MNKLKGLRPERVFSFFEELSAIPRGSGDMERISAYCEDFAKKNNLRTVRDAANNVVIFKNATCGYEDAEPIILQGHLDMVCQKTEDYEIDFEKDGLDIYTDGDFIKAHGTTLGADNGIAVAMIFAILESDDIAHPAIEAVLTTDEETGMIGAGALDTSILSGRKMINLDAEEEGILTVSCAGGSDFVMKLSAEKQKKSGQVLELCLSGLLGGHSGVEINSHRVNANMLAGRVLGRVADSIDIIEINGGNKANAIPNTCTVKILAQNATAVERRLLEHLAEIKEEISAKEPDFEYSLKVGAAGEYNVLSKGRRLIFMLMCSPNGVVEMSAEIEGLVETSLNLGILNTGEDFVIAHFALRSNKKSALAFLEEKMLAFAENAGFAAETFGHYPPWEFMEKSELQKLYKSAYAEMYGTEARVAAIHAGLECAVFSARLPGLDCIAIGPDMSDVHTTLERVSISSVARTFELLKKLLEECR